jgi:excisionase family DNA binding protein
MTARSTTKRRTTKASRSAKPKASQLPLGAVLTLAEVAAYLRLPEATVDQLARESKLPGRWIGDDWRFLKTAVDEWLTGASRTATGWAAAAGAFKDDPDLKKIVRNAYRRRGRPITERKVRKKSG